MAKHNPPFKRFHELIIKPLGLCWEWGGSCSGSGYGQFKAFGKMVGAHRFAYELYKGPIPEGLEVLHSCDNKICVNPAHLSAGTHYDNMKDAGSRGRMRTGDKHPHYGKRHPRPKQAIPVHVLGKDYESQKAAERALGLGSGTVRWWLKNKPDKAHLLTKERHNA